MKILIVGSGAREHALAWKVSRSPLAKNIFIAPGNAGTTLCGKNVPIMAEDVRGLRDFAKKEGVGLTIVGPELPLTLGITDEFERAGLKIFGPSKTAAEIEGNKAFSKDLMSRCGIPTAPYEKFTSAAAARGHIKKTGFPVVIKASGLAAGKGVAVCQGPEDADHAIEEIMVKKVFGPSGDTVVIEECLEGEETSFMAITDGKTILPLSAAEDHKKIYDGDRGPNTGGMGAYSPSVVVTKKMEEKIMDSVMEPAVWALRKEGRPYKGVLYAGLMITEEGPKTLEFNCRFGDPEIEPVIARLKNDVVDVFLAAIEGGLAKVKLSWDNRAALSVVMASKGYPGDFEKGKEISGLSEAATAEDVFLFHAGTAEKEGRILTSGGRVLAVTALGKDLKEAMEKTSGAVDKISWDGVYFRSDIGWKALKLLKEVR